jgi:hypothetical protein
MDYLCASYEEAIARDPGILDRREAEAIARGILVLRADRQKNSAGS